MPTAAQVVAQHLVNRGTCVYPAQGSAANWPVTVSRMDPASATTVTKNFVTCFDSGDLLLGRDMAGDNTPRHNVQVLVRATTYLIGEARCRLILTDLQDLAREGYETVTVSAVAVVVKNCMLTVGLTHLGQDPEQQKLEFFSLNCRLTTG